MSRADQAVFLSYASQDAAAAKQIGEALHAAGVEVWFDQDELRGGDAWDAKIRKQIKACALFVPIISAHTQARPEGYFRLEWKLAVDRSHLMADDEPFLLPVVIDDTPDATARVPDKFRDVQWTRLKMNVSPAEFGERVRLLLQGGAVESGTGDHSEEKRRRLRGGAGGWLAGVRRYWWIPLPFLGLAVASGPFWRSRALPPEVKSSVGVSAISEAAQLTARARAIYERGDLTREDLRAAEELCDQAISIDATEAEAWAARAQVHAWLVFYSYDPSEARKAKAHADAARAMNLAPTSHEARFARAAVLLKVLDVPAAHAEAEEILRALDRERPDDLQVLDSLGLALRARGKNEEAAAAFLRANNPGGAAWTFFNAGDYPRAMDAVERALQKDQAMSTLTLKAVLEYRWREDLDAAQATIAKLPASTLLDESYAMTSVWIALYARDSERALEILRSLQGDYLSALGYTGPKAALLAMAHELAGRPQAAKAEWQAAMKVIDRRLEQHANDPELLWWKASASMALGDAKAAEEQLQLAIQLAGAPQNYVGDDIAGLLIRLGRTEPVLDWLEKRFTQRPPGWERFHSAARFHRDYDPLRGNPRFERLLRENLPAGAKAF